MTTPTKSPLPSRSRPSPRPATPGGASMKDGDRNRLSPPAPVDSPAIRKSVPRAIFPASGVDPENVDPNLPSAAASASGKRSGLRPADAAAAAQPRPRARKFIVVSKKAAGAPAKLKSGSIDLDKCREEALVALRASQEEFSRKESSVAANGSQTANAEVEKFEKINKDDAVRSSVTEIKSGCVMDLVKAFEGKVHISQTPAPKAAIKAAGNQKSAEIFVFSSLESNALHMVARNRRPCCSFNSRDSRSSWDRRSSRNWRSSQSSESFRSSWNSKLRVTNQNPFKLRTEQRGMLKEEQFLKKVQDMLQEEENKRIHIAQGLPWTTDEPEILLKPAVKEPTEPDDVVLHSDTRAIERAEYDHYVAERIKFAEKLRSERERQQKIKEDEEIRTLRKQLVPKAQPMPYFDRPFVPKRSARPLTVPKEPRFYPMRSCTDHHCDH